MKLMTYRTRKATIQDLPILLQFEQGVIQAERPFDPTLKEGDIVYYNIKELITDEHSVVYIVENDTEIVASGYANIKEDRLCLKHSKLGYLGFMYVSETHRGKGINQLIIDALLNWCKEKNILEIKLDVYQDNIPAIRAYEKIGFKKYMINMRLHLGD